MVSLWTLPAWAMLKRPAFIASSSGRLDDGDDIVVALRPVGADDLEAALFVHLADFCGALDGLLDAT